MVLFAWLKPDTWEGIAAGLAVAVAVSQVVYGELKATGLYDWISRGVEPAQSAQGSVVNDQALDNQALDTDQATGEPRPVQQAPEEAPASSAAG